jgi:hypothetical protein
MINILASDYSTVGYESHGPFTLMIYIFIYDDSTWINMVISVATLNNQKAKPVFVPFLSPIIFTIFSEVLRWPTQGYPRSLNPTRTT